MATRSHKAFHISGGPPFVYTSGGVANPDHNFCIPDSNPPQGFTKEAWCTRAREAEIAQAQRENRPPVQIDWRNNECACSRDGSTWRDDCWNPTVLAELRNNTCRTARDCGDGQSCQDNRCVSNSADAPTETEGQPTDQALNNFKTCVDGLAAQARSCKEAGQESSQRCNPQNVAGAQSAQSPTPSTGSQELCLQASFLSNTALHTSHDSSNSCRDVLSRCQSLCGQGENTARQQTESNCLPLLNEGLSGDQRITIGYLASPQNAVEETNSVRAAAHYQSKFQGTENMQTLFRQGFQGCQASQQQQPEMENLVGGIGRALQSAAQCSCQFASNLANRTQTGENGCAGTTPNPNECITNPSARGCEVYREMSVCTPGATYNARLCRCQVQPTAAGCKDVPTTGTLASMAGAMIKEGAVAGESSFGFHNGRKANVDLGGGTEEVSAGNLAPGVNTLQGNSKDVNSGALSSVASGAVPTADIQPAKDGPAKPESTGAVSNLLSAAKGAIKSLGGLADNILDNGEMKNGKSRKDKAPDFNAFRPRGIAGNRSGLGSKNVEIWKMMNRCVQGETCPSNIDRYILAP